MKPIRLISLLLLLGVFFLSCEKEELSGTSKTTKVNKKHSGLRDAANCDCITDYSQSLVTYSSVEAQDVIVEVWNDATTIYYKLYRVGNLQIGNLFVDGGDAIGGDVNNVYTFTKPAIGSCEEQLTSLRVVGANGPPIEFSIVYKMVTLCPKVCLAYSYDSGFGGPSKGAGKAWWYYYPAGSGSQTIFAGQTKPAGTVTIDGSGNYTISLAASWELNPAASESVKIQGYNTVPASRPAAGLFSGPSSYKGTSLSGSISPKPYYVVHLDLRQCTSYQ